MGKSIMPVLAGLKRTQTRGANEGLWWRGERQRRRFTGATGSLCAPRCPAAISPGGCTTCRSTPVRPPICLPRTRTSLPKCAPNTRRIPPRPGFLTSAPEDYAEAQLFSNLLERVIGKYWPYLAGLHRGAASRVSLLSSGLSGWWSAARPIDLHTHMRAPLPRGPVLCICLNIGDLS